MEGSSSHSDPSAESCWLLCTVTITFRIREGVYMDVTLSEYFRGNGDYELESHLCYNSD